LGGRPKDTSEVAELFKDRFPGAIIYETDTKSAELIKYICNCFFAVKVSYLNEIKEICDKIGIDYMSMLPLVLSDGRIGNSHWQVPGHDGSHGFGGKCFPKDLNAFIDFAREIGVDPLVMEAAWRKNLQVREVHDWVHIKGAVSRKKKEE